VNPYLLHHIEKPEVIPESIDNENEFNRIGVEIFKEVGGLLVTIAGGIKVNSSGNEVPYSKEEAVIVGSLVRYSKLSIGFIEQYSQSRLETSMIMLRCLAETYVNLKYFLKYADAHTLRHFIKHSLQTEYEILDILRQNTSDKDVLEPIEERIIKSMSKAFDDADFDKSQMNRSSKWNTKIKQRLSEIIGPSAYALIYGLASHSIHGNWQDLVLYNLEKKDDGFYPYPDWATPRLQILTVSTIFSCDVLANYIERMLPDNDHSSELIAILSDITTRAGRLDQMHEKFIQGK
jgi:hypothetical protein